MTGLLLETQLTAEQQQYAAIVRTSGEALLKVINEILDFSKIEARQLKLEKAEFDLGEVVERAAPVLALKAEEKGIELTCEVDGSAPRRLRGDAGRLRQVLLNLLGNAVKFTERRRGGVEGHAQEGRRAQRGVAIHGDGYGDWIFAGAGGFAV
jgi:two-component system sensor histidine kinase/response regulator